MLLAAATAATSATAAVIGSGRAGLRFEPPPLPRDALLPAMDVAAFVGLAERGPLHQPVLVPDAARFDEVFGGTARIAWDVARSRWLTAALRDAVHAFFANGGRRCWAVRVADERLAVTGRMAVPTLRPLVQRRGAVQADAHSEVEASSPGSWSDGLALRLRLRVEPLSAKGLRWRAGAPQLPASAREPGRRHLLRLRHAKIVETLFVAEGEAQDTPLWWHAEGLAPAPLEALEALAAMAKPEAERWSLERLCLDLQCAGVELQRLGLAAQDPRCWQRASELDAAFALRGAASEAEDLALAWVPVGLGSRWSEALRVPADLRSALRRDGLVGPLHECFVDPRLAETPSARLLEAVRDLRFGTDAANAAPLRGLHALLASPALDDEAEAVSLIVLPDATQPPWVPADAPPALQAGTVLNDAPEAPERALFAACDAPPWPRLTWGRCGVDLRERRLVLAWDAESPAGALPTTGFDIEEAGPDGTRIRAAQVIIPANPAAVRGERSAQPREPGMYRFRLRARRQRPGAAVKPEEAGPWSATLELALHELPMAQTAAEEPAAGADPWPGLARVQGAALALAAARGDLVVLLGLPEQADAERARAHIEVLRALEQHSPATSPPPAAFGALYRPWLLTRGEGGNTRWSPPDGAVCGLLVRRCLERGPWVAPANEALRGALGIAEHDGSAGIEALNPIAPTPRGIAPMEARTLSADAEHAPLQVRRLLATLRRLLEHEGRRWAFEPLDRTLRGAVSQRLRQVLEELERRGAFADVREPWQVSVDSSAGEATLGIELRLKPAAALRLVCIQMRTTAGQPAQWQEALA